MQTLVYAKADHQNRIRLETAVQAVIPESQIELFRSLPAFQDRLRMLIEPDSIAILSAASREELERMLLLREWMLEIYVVLVLPDRNKETIETAHLLLPRFLSQKESDFADLKIVLAKMYGNSQSNRLPA